MTVKIDMKMPMSCAVCPLSLHRYDGKDAEGELFCPAISSCVEYVQGRHPDCPLKEVK